MNLKNKALRFIKNPFILIHHLGIKQKLNFMSDDLYLKIIFRIRKKKKLNLKNPETFNEKLQYLKLYDRNPLYTKLVDKLEVRKYVADIIGENYLVPLLGVWDSFEEIDFTKLPNQFVLKTNHDSGGVIICKDKNQINQEKSRKIIIKSLKRNYYYGSREWPYKDVKPKIICEKYLEEPGNTGLKDYKVYCFSGEPTYCQVISGREENKTVDFYDKDWNRMAFTGLSTKRKSDTPMKKPADLHTMLQIARDLSKDYPFIRVDFYYIKEKIYFGELTLYPAGGFGKFTPSKYDKILGDLIVLP